MNLDVISHSGFKKGFDLFSSPRIKGTDGSDMKMLVKEGFKEGENTDLKQENPTAEPVNSEVQNNIQQCQMINTSGDCGLTVTNNCGYCVSTDTIAAGDKKNPFENILVIAEPFREKNPGQEAALEFIAIEFLMQSLDKINIYPYQ